MQIAVSSNDSSQVEKVIKQLNSVSVLTNEFTHPSLAYELYVTGGKYMMGMLSQDQYNPDGFHIFDAKAEMLKGRGMSSVNKTKAETYYANAFGIMLHVKSNMGIDFYKAASWEQQMVFCQIIIDYAEMLVNDDSPAQKIKGNQLLNEVIRLNSLTKSSVTKNFADKAQSMLVK